MFDESVAVEALDRLRDAVHALLGLSVACASDEFVLAALRAVQAHTNRLAALDAVLVGEVDGRRLHVERACADTARLLVQLLRIDPGHAKARVAAAAELGPRRSLTGQALDPIYPSVAAALGEGAITARHAGVITRTIDALPAAVAAEHDRAVETLLVEHAREHTPHTLALIARRVADTLDPDGTLATEADRNRRRHLDLHQRPDGSAVLRGELDAVCTEALLTVLDPLARPTPTSDGQRDPRTPSQRRHDGLRDALLTAIRAGQLPDAGGITTTILLTTTADQLHTNTGLARTGHGALLPIPTITRHLLGDAQLMPITLTRDKQIERTGSTAAATRERGGVRIENYGPARRLFTASQRLALAARDGGCSFPHCTVPPAWCQAHHVIPYTDGGPTTPDNGTLLCGYHHRHFDHLGWTCHMHNGTPHWTPPPWIDPEQRAVRNTVRVYRVNGVSGGLHQ